MGIVISILIGLFFTICVCIGNDQESKRIERRKEYKKRVEDGSMYSTFNVRTGRR
jgi:hypothetical protein